MKKPQAENYYKHRLLRLGRPKGRTKDSAKDNVTEAISSSKHDELEKSEQDEHLMSPDHCPSRPNEAPVESDSDTAAEGIT